MDSTYTLPQSHTNGGAGDKRPPESDRDIGTPRDVRRKLFSGSAEGMRRDSWPVKPL